MSIYARSFTMGVLLIILGLLFLANNLGWMVFSWETIWPWLVIAGGGVFWLQWFMNRKNSGLLMPGTILLVYGFLFLYCAHSGWWYMEQLWPFFLIGPGLGFFFMYLLGEREKGLLVPSVILIGLGGLFLSGAEKFRLLWPVLFIIIGIVLLLRAGSKTRITPESSQRVNSDKIPPSES